MKTKVLFTLRVILSKFSFGIQGEFNFLYQLKKEFSVKSYFKVTISVFDFIPGQVSCFQTFIPGEGHFWHNKFFLTGTFLQFCSKVSPPRHNVYKNVMLQI